MNNNDNNKLDVCSYIYKKISLLFSSLSCVNPENNFIERQKKLNIISKIIDNLPVDCTDTDVQNVLTKKQYDFYQEYM
jgi:hypothetical protein